MSDFEKFLILDEFSKNLIDAFVSDFNNQRRNRGLVEVPCVDSWFNHKELQHLNEFINKRNGINYKSIFLFLPHKNRENYPEITNCTLKK